MIKESPKSIFLQFHENDGEITWSEDRINESDVEYLAKEQPVVRFSHDEKLQMAENMRTYGGSFVKALAECFVRADGSNLDKLINTFPEYVKQYLEWKK